MGFGVPALVFAGGLTIAARIWSAVRRVPTPFNDGPMSPPSRPMRWQTRQLLSAMTLFTCSASEAFRCAQLLGAATRVDAGAASLSGRSRNSHAHRCQAEDAARLRILDHP